jgi:hypothetical protein
MGWGARRQETTREDLGVDVRIANTAVYLRNRLLGRRLDSSGSVGLLTGNNDGFSEQNLRAP